MMSELTDAQRKRRTDRFKHQLRLDLLAGRAAQWEVSSPRDELEKIRFFFRTSEAFVDQAESSEVDTLRDSVKDRPKDAQDEFLMWYYPAHWNDIFRPILRQLRRGFSYRLPRKHFNADLLSGRRNHEMR